MRDLKAQGREALRRFELAEKRAQELLAESHALGKQAKELQRDGFGEESKALECETRGDKKAAAAFRAQRDRLHAEAEAVYKKADEIGERSATLEREAFHQKKMALRIADKLKELMEKGGAA